MAAWQVVEEDYLYDKVWIRCPSCGNIQDIPKHRFKNIYPGPFEKPTQICYDCEYKPHLPSLRT